MIVPMLMPALAAHSWFVWPSSFCRRNTSTISLVVFRLPVLAIASSSEKAYNLTQDGKFWGLHQIDILIQEGRHFVCPWTARPIQLNDYDLDHILPISAYPINELWNLVPSDPGFNRNKKRDLLPGKAALTAAIPRLAGSYAAYRSLPQLKSGLDEDVLRRFGHSNGQEEWDGRTLAEMVSRFVSDFAGGRNLRTFGD